jgi:hypothetical protein
MLSLLCLLAERAAAYRGESARKFLENAIGYIGENSMNGLAGWRLLV